MVNHRLIANNISATAIKIAALWTVFLLGTLFHTQLALMPLFHGMDVLISHTHEVIRLDVVIWFMLVFFMLPLLAILGCLFLPSLLFRQVHFAMTLIYTMLNLVHLIADELVSVPGYQLLLMFLLLFIGLMLNWVSFSWMSRPDRTLKISTAYRQTP